METLTVTGLDGSPWPELMRDRRPALVLPAVPGRPVLLEDGWADRDTALAVGPRPAWSAVLAARRLTVRRPGGMAWLDAEIPAIREWRRAVREHRTLLLITGPFTSVFDFRPTAAAGRLLLLTAAARALG